MSGWPDALRWDSKEEYTSHPDTTKIASRTVPASIAATPGENQDRHDNRDANHHQGSDDHSKSIRTGFRAEAPPPR